MVASRAAVARLSRPQRSISARKSGVAGVGSFESAFSTANSAILSTAHGKWASFRLR